MGSLAGTVLFAEDLPSPGGSQAPAQAQENSRASASVPRLAGRLGSARGTRLAPGSAEGPSRWRFWVACFAGVHAAAPQRSLSAGCFAVSGCSSRVFFNEWVSADVSAASALRVRSFLTVLPARQGAVCCPAVAGVPSCRF